MDPVIVVVVESNVCRGVFVDSDVPLVVVDLDCVEDSGDGAGYAWAYKRDKGDSLRELRTLYRGLDSMPPELRAIATAAIADGSVEDTSLVTSDLFNAFEV